LGNIAATGLLARGNHRKLAVRVLREQAQQLDTGIAGSAYDSDLERLVCHARHPSPIIVSHRRKSRPQAAFVAELGG